MEISYLTKHLSQFFEEANALRQLLFLIVICCISFYLNTISACIYLLFLLLVVYGAHTDPFNHCAAVTCGILDHCMDGSAPVTPFGGCCRECPEPSANPGESSLSYFTRLFHIYCLFTTDRLYFERNGSK